MSCRRFRPLSFEEESRLAQAMMEEAERGWLRWHRHNERVANGEDPDEDEKGGGDKSKGEGGRKGDAGNKGPHGPWRPGRSPEDAEGKPGPEDPEGKGKEDFEGWPSALRSGGESLDSDSNPDNITQMGSSDEEQLNITQIGSSDEEQDQLRLLAAERSSEKR